MARKLTTFELEPQPKRPKKAPKEKKTMKKRLPIIVPFAIVFIAVLGIVLFLYLNASAVNNTSITVQGNDAPVSTAEIVNTGFTAAAPVDGTAPARLEGATVGDSISAFCEVGAYNGVTSELTITWILPDGTQGGSETFSVNADGFYYADATVSGEGVYEASWSLDGKLAASSKLTVAAAPDAESVENTADVVEGDAGAEAGSG